MKWINLSLLVIWLCLLGLGIFWAWQSFDNAQVIAGGGYVYDNDGKTIGMYDTWEKNNWPDWMFGLAAPIILLTEMPVWWMVGFWGIGLYLGYLLWFVYRPCIALE